MGYKYTLVDDEDIDALYIHRKTKNHIMLNYRLFGEERSGYRIFVARNYADARKKQLEFEAVDKRKRKLVIYLNGEKVEAVRTRWQHPKPRRGCKGVGTGTVGDS